MIRKKFLAFFLFLLGLDIASKLAAIHWIPPLAFGDYPYGGIGAFSDFFGVSFSLNYTVNTGAAWGVFSGHSGLLFALRTVVILGLISYLLFFRREETPQFALWVVATGAIGNALDYIFYRHVIDFFHFVFWGYSFPIFNLADSYITLGVVGLVLLSRKAKKPLRVL